MSKLARHTRKYMEFVAPMIIELLGKGKLDEEIVSEVRSVHWNVSPLDIIDMLAVLKKEAYAAGSGAAGTKAVYDSSSDHADIAEIMLKAAEQAKVDLVKLAHVVQLVTIENLLSSPHSDQLTGNGDANVIHGQTGDDVIEGKGGPDKIDGGEGYDTASYASSPAGVQIDLTASTAKGGDAEGDTLVSIENLIGSPHSDQLTGNREPNVMHGQAGDDIIDGRAGADDLDGGDGNDTVTYRNSPAGVTVSLVKGVIGQGGDARGDLLLNFENLTGSQHSDKLTGDNNDNIIQGLGGGDDLDGGDGIDTLSYEDHDKVVNVDLFDNGSARPRRGADTFNNFENIIGSLKSDTLSGDNKPN
ncbi:hypothetical protein EDM53_02945, partial [Rickettsiales endosymbiont of Peranema trichophorum]